MSERKRGDEGKKREREGGKEGGRDGMDFRRWRERNDRRIGSMKKESEVKLYLCEESSEYSITE